MPFTSARYVQANPDGTFSVVWDGQVVVFPTQQEAEQAYNDMAGLPNTGGPAGGPAGSPTGGSISDLLDALLGSNRERFDWEKEVEKWRQAFQEKQAYSTLAQSLLGTAAGLTGPRDWLKYQQYTGGGRGLLDQLYGSNPRPSFVAPGGTSEPLTIQDLLAQLGLGNVEKQTPASGQGFLPTGPTTGAESTQRPVLTGQNPTAGAAAAAAGPTAIGEPTPATRAPAQLTPTADSARYGGTGTVQLPFQVNPAVWDAMSPTAKEMIFGMLQAGMAEGGYWDPSDWLAQMNASRPRGFAPRRTQVSWAQPAGVF